MKDKEIIQFAKWYTYELHKFTFLNRAKEPTLSEWRELKQ
jgi:aryl carrier-like protein